MKIKIYQSAIIGGIIGGILFIYLYGIAVLNPTFDAWLMQGEDLNQHYLGWEFFRDSPWMFPVGMIQGISVEPVSVISTDSIPLFALFFKLLSPILPSVFQYFGLFGIVCFVLQGIFGALIVRRFTEDTLCVTFGTLFFVFSYVVFMRMYGHTALAANWLILAAFCIFLYRKIFSSKFTALKLWTALFSVTVLIHLYFIPMIAAVLFVQAMTDVAEDKNWKNLVCIFAIPIGTALVILYCLGAFYGGISAEDIGYGIYSSNLNTFFNPLQYSKFLPALPLAIRGQWEGSAYLGLGVMLLLVIAVVGLMLSLKTVHINKWSCLLGILASLGLTVFAVSNRVAWGETILAEFNIPVIWQKLGGIFRSGGRLIWPVMYLLIILALAGTILLRRYWKWMPAVILAVCALLQITDLSPMWLGIKNTDRANVEYETALTSSAWEAIGDSKIDKIEVFTIYGTYDRKEAPINYYYGLDDTFDLAEFAQKNGMSINDFYLSRRNGKAIEEEKVRAYQDILDGKASEEVLYVFLNVPKEILEREALHIYEIDGFIIGLSDSSILSQEDVKEISAEDSIPMIYPNRVRFSDGEWKDGKYIVNPQGVMESNDCSVPSGYYEVQITGEKLKNTSVVLYDSNSGRALPLENVVQEDDEMRASFSLRGGLDTLRVNILNEGSEPIAINEVNLMSAY